jgi:hypothetical protein
MIISGWDLKIKNPSFSSEKAGACYLMSEPSYLRPFAATLEDFTSKMC